MSLITRAWAKYLVGPGVSCPSLPFTQRPRSKLQLPEILVDRQRSKPQVYQMFVHNKYKPSSFTPNLNNEIEALKSRVLKQTPIVNPDTMATFTEWVKVNYRKLFPGFRKQYPCDIDEYLSNSNAAPAVKRQIKRAKDECVSRGINHYSKLPRGELYKWTTRKAFVKVENALYDSPGHTLLKAPRLIQGAPPEFVAHLGPTFMKIQREVKRVWGKRHFVYFTSGAKAHAISRYICDIAGRWFENDVSSFDCSVGEALCKLEIWLARKMGALPLDLQLMEANIKTHGRSSKGIKYSCIGTRKSGDPYTSVMNSILNGLMHVFCLHQAGMTFQSMRRNLRMLVQGDDNLLRHPSNIIVDWDILLQLGFKADNIYRNGPHDAEFCSSRLYPIATGYCFGPKIGRLLNKLLCFNNPPNVHPLSIARGVALGMQSYDYVPFVKEMVAMILKQCGDVDPYFQVEDWKMQYTKQIPDVPSCNWMLDEVYGVNSWSRKILEKRILNLKFGQEIDTPLVNMLFDKDTSAHKCIFAA